MFDLDARSDLEPSPRAFGLGVMSNAMLAVSAMLVAGVESLSPLDEVPFVLLSRAESDEFERVIAVWDESVLFPKLCKKDNIQVAVGLE